MSITDELRKEARGFGRYVYTAPQADCLTAIADRIDAEHERTVGFCKRLEDAAAKREDVEIFGVEYTALPLDADGVPIHVGDTVWGCISGMEMTVKELRLTDTGRLVVTTTRGLMPISSKVTHTLPR